MEQYEQNSRGVPEHIASYYSLDGKEWQMVRLYRNNYPKNLKVGISSQAPQKGQRDERADDVP